MAAGLNHVLLLSNGHGEDLSGALIARELMGLGVQVEALPLVGHGQAYRQADIPVLGITREFSTGGLGYTSLTGRFTELREGQYCDLLRRLARLRGRRDRLVVAVGDLLPVLVAWLIRRPTAVYLVAYSSHYEGRLRLPWPCGWLLRRRPMQRIWSRDPLTASDLSNQLQRPVQFLGNPFLDLVADSRPELPSSGRQSLAVLPGSRLPEALRNLESLLALLSRLPQRLHSPERLCLRAGLVSSLDVSSIARIAAPLGWRMSEGEPGGESPASQVLQRGEQRLELHWGRFAAVLRSSDLVLSMTGTAAEQAVGLGKPVLQLEGQGPQFTAGFAEAQRRLLGPGLLCASGADDPLQASADVAAAALDRLADPERGPAWSSELAAEGRQRIGDPGGSRRMAAAIMELLESLPAPVR